VKELEHVKALLIKGVATIVLLFLVLGIGYDVSIIGVLGLSILLGALSYVAGDLFILPKYGNLMATFGDFVLTFLVVWAGLQLISFAGSAVIASLISAAFIAVAEYGFHLYLSTHVLPANNRIRTKMEGVEKS
jgi:Protein of unknown function (DUF2512)